jgi:6-phosphogluconate dehydrogenase
MAEPLHSIWRKGYVILSAILLSISSRLSRRNSSSILIIIIQFKKATLSKLPKFARGIESYVVYMVVGDDT